MADIENPTGDITLYDENGNAVEVVLRADGKYALAVDAKITGFSVIADVRSLEQKLADEGRLFTASTDLISLGGSSGQETPFMLIKNPTGKNDQWVRLFQILYRLHTTSSFSVVLRVYKNPTVTSDGTGLAEINENNDSVRVADAEVFVNPTVSANGSFEQAFNLTNQATMEINFNLSKIIEEGNSWLITYEKSSGSNVDIIGTIWWGEEDKPL